MKNIIAGLLIFIVLVSGGFWLATRNTDDTNKNTTSPNTTSTNPTPSNTATSPTPSGSQNTNQSADEASDTEASAVITYTQSGFSPSTVTVKSGDTVSIKNNSDIAIQFNSDPHPTHTENEELNAGSVGPGETKTFTVNQKGTFGFHNHFNDDQKGTITIQ